MIEITEGLKEVIESSKLTHDQKAEAIRNFALPVHNLDTGEITPPLLAEEDAELIIEALEDTQ